MSSFRITYKFTYFYKNAGYSYFAGGSEQENITMK